MDRQKDCQVENRHLRKTAMKLWLSKRSQRPKPMMTAPNSCGKEKEVTLAGVQNVWNILTTHQRQRKRECVMLHTRICS